MKRKVVLRCLSCLLTGMLLLESPLQVFAEQTNDTVQSDVENENQDTEPVTTDEPVDEAEVANPTEDEEQKDVPKTEENKEDESNQETPPADDKAPSQEVPPTDDETSNQEIPPTDDENTVTEENKTPTEDSSDEIKSEDKVDAVTPAEDEANPDENTPTQELPSEDLENLEPKEEQTETEDEIDGFFVLTGEQYGTEAAYLGEKKELLADYQEVVGVLQNTLREKKSELSLKEMLLNPEIIQDLLVYIVNDTDVDCSYLLPLVTYTYVEKADEENTTTKNVYSVRFSYLTQESQLTLTQESRSLKDGVKLAFTTDASVETYRLYQTCR